MLVFIDESGDTGLKLEQGSSAYFVVALVLFDDLDEANLCDKTIENLRKTLRKPTDYEFHFFKNSAHVKKAFLEAISTVNFVYFAVVIDKAHLYGQGFKHKEAFYKYVCHMAFMNAKPYIDQATIILDKTGNPVFRNQLAAYLRKKINTNDRHHIKKVKQQPSHKNNLIQLADYVASIINHQVQGKKSAQEYYRAISSKEMHIQQWPRPQNNKEQKNTASHPEKGRNR